MRRLLRLPLHTPAQIQDEVDDELTSYLAALVDDLVARGLSREDAHAEALRRLGGTIDETRARLHQSAQHREARMRLSECFDDFVQDLRYAARGLVRRPGFTIVAVLTLAIGIGATTTIFSAVNALLLRPLPFARPDELMKVSLTTPDRSVRGPNDDMVWSYPKFLVFREAQQIFAQLSVYAQNQFTVTSGDVELVRGESVGARYLRVLGLSPVVGRDFALSVDAHPGAEREVILSTSFWQRRYNADPSVIGQTIELDRTPFTIIGVAPPGFEGLSGHVELFVPVTTRSVADLGQAYSHEFYLVGRRRAGLTAEQATAAVRDLGRRVREAFPDTRFGNGVWGATASPLDNARVAPLIRRAVLVLFGAVGFVLLIACVNVANLLLGRASARRREIAVRLAIGAGRGRLVRLLLTESLLLAALGGAASLAVGWTGAHALSVLNPATAVRGRGPGGLGTVTFAAIHMDWVSLAFTFGITLLVGVAFGLVPALHATRASVASAMKEGPAIREGHVAPGRRMLVVLEVALAMVLLAGSGLMIRSLTNLLAIDPGFDGRGVLTTRLTIPPGPSRDSLPTFYTALLDRLRAVPGVSEAALSNCLPLNGGCNSTKIEFVDRPRVDFAHMPNVGINWASPSWFAAMHVPLKRGRLFTTADRVGTPKVLVVNEAAARAFWPNENPLGKRVEVGQGGFSDGAEVIGIVGGVRQTIDSLAKPEVYIPYYQSPSPRMMLFIRASGDPAALGTAVRSAIRELAPRYPVYDMQTMSARTAGATAQARFSAILLAIFAAVALSLAVIGIYGVMSLAVTQRTREIGIRMALGADDAAVRRMVVGEAAGLALAGALVGLAGALAFTRVLSAELFEVTPSDPVTYLVMVVVLAAAAILASWLPARRATRVHPTEALRAG